MRTTEVTTESAGHAGGTRSVDMKLEVVVLPVSDVNRAKEFYERLGWRVDADFAAHGDYRIVQMTPPGSPASIHFGAGVTNAAPGSIERMVLVVDDIETARAELIARGVDVSEVFHGEDGLIHHADAAARVPGRDPNGASYGSGAAFSDPDGNGWLLQEITTRLPGRIDGAATSFASASDLSEALQRAAAAHGEHEARIGREDPDWPDWYAEYMVRDRAGEQLAS